MQKKKKKWNFKKYIFKKRKKKNFQITIAKKGDF